jgi:hypothetical protein
MIQKSKLRKAWCAETSYYNKFDSTNPAKGQCLPTALLVQDIEGGEIWSCKVGNIRHYYNVTEIGEVVDYTVSQFPDLFKVAVAYHNKLCVINRDKILVKYPDIKSRYELLKERYEERKPSS